MKAGFVEAEIEALIQAKFDIVTEVSGTSDRLANRYGFNEIESARLELDVLIALR
jgi:hypothetical protein